MVHMITRLAPIILIGPNKFKKKIKTNTLDPNPLWPLLAPYKNKSEIPKNYQKRYLTIPKQMPDKWHLFWDAKNVPDRKLYFLASVWRQQQLIFTFCTPFCQAYCLVSQNICLTSVDHLFWDSRAHIIVNKITCAINFYAQTCSLKMGFINHVHHPFKRLSICALSSLNFNVWH